MFYSVSAGVRKSAVTLFTLNVVKNLTNSILISQTSDHSALEAFRQEVIMYPRVN